MKGTTRRGRFISVFEPGIEKGDMSHKAEKGETCLTKLRQMFHQAGKCETHVSLRHYISLF